MSSSETRSRWSVAEDLLRELGSLRRDASGLQGIDPAAADEVEELIGQAAQAVSGTMSGAESDALLLGACEAMAAARHRIDSLREDPSVSRPPAARAMRLQHKAARLLFERVRGGGAT